MEAGNGGAEQSGLARISIFRRMYNSLISSNLLQTQNSPKQRPQQRLETRVTAARPSNPTKFLFSLLLLASVSAAPAQTPAAQPEQTPATIQKSQAPQPSGGSSTAGAHAPVFDSEKRPITAGGFVKSGPIVFQDIAAKAGLTTWTHNMGTPDKNFIIETNGSGVALLDYDNDGWLDIYLVNGSTFDALDGKADAAPRRPLPQQPRRHLHRRHRESRRHQRPLGLWRRRRRLRQRRLARHLTSPTSARTASTTTITTAPSPTSRRKPASTLGNWSTGATWGDYDGDGRLDLFVSGYVHFDRDNCRSRRKRRRRLNAFCQFRGVNVMCGPRGLKGEPDHLFHNNGDGTFTDVSEKAGVADKQRLLRLHLHLCRHRTTTAKPDLLVANDSTPNYLYINKGDGTFEDDSYASGYRPERRRPRDRLHGHRRRRLQNNGLLDLFNTTFSDDYKPLYRNDGDANFTDDQLRRRHRRDRPIPFLGWGTAFFDYDNDGWKDLFMVNGHVYPRSISTTGAPPGQSALLLFHNRQTAS